MGIECSVTRNRGLQWYGHVQRMSEHMFLKRISEWNLLWGVTGGVNCEGLKHRIHKVKIQKKAISVAIH